MSAKAGLDRAVVVQAAAALADRIGLEEVTLAALAAHLKVRTPSLYNHIEGLAGLRRELALLAMHTSSQWLGQAVMGKAGDEAILALGHTYRAFVKEHPGLYMATVHAPAADDQELQEAGREVVDVILRVLAAYKLQGEDAIHAARALRSIAHGFATLEIAGGFGIPLSLDESYERLLQTFIAGLHHTL